MIGLKDIEYILGTVEENLTSHLYIAPQIEPVYFDKWLVSSALNKAIRRSHTQIALNCAAPLVYGSRIRDRLWRRLGVIALEDIGIGDIGIIAEVLAVCASSKWRQKVAMANNVLQKQTAECAVNKKSDHEMQVYQAVPTPALCRKRNLYILQSLSIAFTYRVHKSK